MQRCHELSRATCHELGRAKHLHTNARVCNNSNCNYEISEALREAAGPEGQEGGTEPEGGARNAREETCQKRTEQGCQRRLEVCRREWNPDYAKERRGGDYADLMREQQQEEKAAAAANDGTMTYSAYLFGVWACYKQGYPYAPPHSVAAYERRETNCGRVAAKTNYYDTSNNGLYA